MGHSSAALARYLLQSPRRWLNTVFYHGTGRRCARVYRRVFDVIHRRRVVLAALFCINLPVDTSPGASEPYRISPILAKQVGAIFSGYLAAGLVEHSTCPFAFSLEVVPKASGGTRVTVPLGKGRPFSLFGFTPSFRQITVDKDHIILKTFCTPAQLFQWLQMPQV